MNSNKRSLLDRREGKVYLEKRLSTEEEEDLLKVNAASLLLSYIRPQIRSITSLSKFREQNIPFIDFTSQL